MSKGRVTAILVGIAISLGLTNGFDGPWYVSLPLGAVGYLGVRFAHTNLSWKLGYGRGKAGRPWSEPWWVDRLIYALAYMQGKGVEIPSKGREKS